MTEEIYNRITDAFVSLKSEAISLLRNLVRIPSVNNPPHGDEEAVQEYFSEWLSEHDIANELIYPNDIPQFETYPGRLREHEMSNRPNVKATISGNGKGRSLLLLAHADVVPIGSETEWEREPFSGEIENGCLYGRGSGDDKCGMAIAAVIPLILRRADVELTGDLTIASIADEEAGGGNGVAALFCSGVKADAAVYLDGSNQEIWNAGLGGGFLELSIDRNDEEEIDMIRSVAHDAIQIVKRERYATIIGHPDFGEKFFEKTMEGFWDVNVQTMSEKKLKMSFLLDTLPSEDEESLKRDVENIILECLSPFKVDVTMCWMSRFLKPAQALPTSHPLVATLGESFHQASGREARITSGRQSDQGLVATFGQTPCVLFGCGRRGKEGAPHLPNEFILLKEFEENLLTATLMAAKWCGG